VFCGLYFIEKGPMKLREGVRTFAEAVRKLVEGVRRNNDERKKGTGDNPYSASFLLSFFFPCRSAKSC
jgi:hypothetical protein